MNRRDFESALASASSEDDRLACFGALLALESGVGDRLVIVGGSAVEIYLTPALYTSQDIDVVGDRAALEPVLARWGFSRAVGRDRRVYWIKKGFGQVDLVGTQDRSGLPPRPWPTPFGRVMVGSIEYLIVGRLMRSTREERPELFHQAELLAKRYRKRLDWSYIRVLSKRERVLPLYEQLRKNTLVRKPRRRAPSARRS
jgi:hypothetical protein